MGIAGNDSKNKAGTVAGGTEAGGIVAGGIVTGGGGSG